jgi:S-adenosylmethionine hydrolase
MIVTLLTDFGLEDEYVGVVKGVILGVNPSAQIVDTCHQIPLGDVTRASWLLSWSWRYFPRGTVHLTVVDPGVGSPRQILCLRLQGHLFLAPDNGVLTQVLAGVKNPQLTAVQNRRYALPSVSHTFHGRDIFAPAAGFISKGLAPSRLGPRVRTFVRLALPLVKANRRRLVGQVIHLDRFGNAVTNLPRDRVRRLQQKGAIQARLKGQLLHGIQRSYAAVGKGKLVAVIGSHDLLEIAVNQGSAARQLHLKIGDPIVLQASV